MKTALEFVILCSNRWPKTGVSARQKSVFPRCRDSADGDVVGDSHGDGDGDGDDDDGDGDDGALAQPPPNSPLTPTHPLMYTPKLV